MCCAQNEELSTFVVLYHIVDNDWIKKNARKMPELFSVPLSIAYGFIFGVKDSPSNQLWTGQGLFYKTLNVGVRCLAQRLGDLSVSTKDEKFLVLYTSALSAIQERKPQVLFHLSHQVIILQGSTNRRAPGFVNCVPALANHFWLNLPAPFTQAGARLFVEPCT